MANRIVNIATSVVSQHYSLTELSPGDTIDPVSPRKRSRESEEATKNGMNQAIFNYVLVYYIT